MIERPAKRKFNVPRLLAHTSEIAGSVEVLMERHKEKAGDEQQGRLMAEVIAYNKGARGMALEVLALLRDWPMNLQIIQDDTEGDEDTRLKGLCEYSQELDAERLEVLITIRVIQEERAARRGGGPCQSQKRRE